MSTKARHALFTYNNPTHTPEDFQALLEAAERVRYAIFQLEVGENGTPHYQGYVEYSSPQRFSYFHNNFARCHLEKRAGTREQARDYCRKEDTRQAGPWEVGNWSSGGSGSRTDLTGVVDACKTGSLKRVAEEHPDAILRYSKGIQLLCRLHAPARADPPTVTLLYGLTGLGKTHFVNSRWPIGPVTFKKAPDTRWFDGYYAQDVLLLDDFSGASSKMSLAYVLQLLDRYPFDIEIKGDTVPLLATKIFITTNIHPSNWFKWNGRKIQYPALARRFHHVIGFSDDRVPHLLDKTKFFGQLVEHQFDNYTAHNCDWEEVYSSVFLPEMFNQ